MSEDTTGPAGHAASGPKGAGEDGEIEDGLVEDDVDMATVDVAEAVPVDPVDPLDRSDEVDDEDEGDEVDEGDDDKDEGEDDDEGDEDEGDEGDDEVGADGAPTGGQVAYDLADWAGESRAMLRQLLEAEDVVHAWEGTTLVVPDECEAATDELVEQVEVTTLPTLDPDAEAIAYDLSDWNDEQLTLLQSRLQEDGIPYEFDVNGDLVSVVDHQERLEALIDAVEFPDAAADADLAADVDDEDDEDDDEDDEDDEDDGAGAADDDLDDSDDGPDGAVVLSDLFVAADRLMHHARDHEGVLEMVAAAKAAQRIRLPYGFDPVVWRGIVEQASALEAALEGEGVSDEDVEEQARQLRDSLRDYV